VERIAGRFFDAIVPATPEIAKRFPVKKTVLVQNFPILEELVAPVSVAYDSRPPHFAYVGGITRARGAVEMVEAISRISSGEAGLRLAGAFSPKNLQREIEALPGWNKVDFLGWADRKQVANHLGNVRAGLVLFHPGPNHCSAQPNKMFEYMAAGLPVIASDFPLWREIVDGAGCGLLVDPLDPDAISEAMQWILDHPKEAEAMGRRGRQAVEEKYNWERESQKLIGLYRRLLNK
jgi:glycosyltransferase involved in cell wall biosynthesis